MLFGVCVTGEQAGGARLEQQLVDRRHWSCQSCDEVVVHLPFFTPVPVEVEQPEVGPYDGVLRERAGCDAIEPTVGCRPGQRFTAWGDVAERAEVHAYRPVSRSGSASSSLR